MEAKLYDWVIAVKDVSGDGFAAVCDVVVVAYRFGADESSRSKSV
jgi:hypothetical protein